jgi:hypothetical protein
VNALADAKVAEYVREHLVATYLKVGTFRIVNGQKQGGNVASYFCHPDGAVLHAVAGPVNADVLLREARWALETRKSAVTLSTNLATGDLEPEKYREQVRKAHRERFRAETQLGAKANRALPFALPRADARPAQVHWVLATNPLAALEDVYPVVWQQILGEQLSGLPVARK